ncbi:stealth family protein [Photobacterium damselae]|uniref:stealth family protein n=1 Tax=Photobacterium damselae TaxID=38293 RepID=UPI001EDCCBF7|nr:stealth family protein [Photobacterium damselae]MCG3825609.1 Stealth CR1 domain-containing protein [Photobacterium damselae]
MNSIDIVIPWVDGGDPKWQEDFKQYHSDPKSTDARFERYRDWDLLKYWFRGVEKYAPWVRKVHFITYGHVPAWLDVNNEKLNIVNHKDYIDEKYLPVFNANPIEIGIHNINDLSEQFIYFNDDFYLINDTTEADFFTNGLPNDLMIMNAISGLDKTMLHISVNNLYAINSNFNKFDVIRGNYLNFFNFKYNTKLIRNFLLSPWPNFTGFFDHHLPQPFLKETYNHVWKAEKNILEETMKSRFRSISDVNQYLFRYWQLCSGKFNPFDLSKLGQYYQVSDSNIMDISACIKTTNKKIIVLNDGQVDDFDRAQVELIAAFEDKLPNKSMFEL